MNRFVGLLAFFASTALLGDSITLRSGGVVTGTILSQNRDSVVVRVSGGTRRIPKSDIRRIAYAEEPAPVRREPAATRPPPKRPEQTRVAAADRRNERPAPESPSGVGEALYVGGLSALWPGWGLDYKQGGTTWRWTYTSIVAALAVGTAATHASGTTAQSTYAVDAPVFALGAAVVPFSQAGMTTDTSNALRFLLAAELTRPSFARAQSRARLFNVSIAVLGIVYVGQVLHAGLSGTAAPAAPGSGSSQRAQASGPWFSWGGDGHAVGPTHGGGFAPSTASAREGGSRDFALGWTLTW